jgi:hypothetical protein
MALALSSVAGQIVDRVVTSVNGHVILQSDWEQEVAIEAFSNARDPDSFTSAEGNAALNLNPLPPHWSLPALRNSASSIRSAPPTRDGAPLCNVMASRKSRLRKAWATRSS